MAWLYAWLYCFYLPGKIRKYIITVVAYINLRTLALYYRHSIMRSIVILLTVFITATAATAQSRQQQKVDSVFQQVKKYFNQKNADAIYNMAGADFQKELSIDVFDSVANKQLFPLGEIKETTLISFVNNNVATYKLKFDTITLQLLRLLNSINQFLQDTRP